jgi:dihydroorotate dehydrogenase
MTPTALAYRTLRPLLFALPPETAHELAMTALAPVEAVLERAPVAAVPDPMLSQEIWGLTFPNPVGLAAGFDKNAALPHVWAALGFGFAELGTITANPQPGNPPPRVFRLTDARALVNRLGFNNRGAAAIAPMLRARLARRCAIPVGINIGKSRVTPVAEAIGDYLRSFAALYDSADYVVINVSSPNTPGLRGLQDQTQLAPLLRAIQTDNRRLAAASGVRVRPVLVKVAPDLDDAGLRGIVEVALDCEIAGLVATNTTIERRGVCADHPLAGEAGGLSGAPLRERATAVVAALAELSAGRIPIIGVGGIFSADDAYEKIRAGASLVQVYTGFVYEGPGLAHAIAQGLRALLARDGFAHLREAVGADRVAARGGGRAPLP